jgi:homoserine dehydrogenase
MSRKVIVLKFGSSVLQSRADLPAAVHEIYRWIRRQYRVVAVVSAFAGETDRLLETVADYRDTNTEAIARVVATGEEVATAFLALELDRFGVPAQVLDPSQIQLLADVSSGEAGSPASPGFGLAGVLDTEPVSADVTAIQKVLNHGRVAVIPGFVARDRAGRVALFGRGGSDLSALFLARQLNARCRLIKDVDGIYNSDPATSPAARRFEEISFSDALAIAGKVVQQKAIAFGRKTAVPFEVSALGEDCATLVGSHHSTLATRTRTCAPLKIGLLGLGTVGLGVFQELWKRPDLFEVTGIAVRHPELHSDHAPCNLITRNCWEAIHGVDVVVELIGGNNPASDLVYAALAAGKPVVTANKLLIANDRRLGTHHALRYSAAVGGAVPALEAVQALVHSDAGIISLSGVLNGTCNYILDRIAAGCPWDQALAEAQAHGFAEQDPSADLSGSDTVCKLRLLARRAFPQADAHYITATGIDSIDADWVQSVARDGGRARLVGTAQLADGRVHLDVKPALVDASHPFAQIRNEENCLMIHTEQSGAQQIWTGRGAGRWPTTAAVMADLFDLSRELRASNSELRAVSALHPGTTSVVPYAMHLNEGFSPCNTEQTQGLKAGSLVTPAARLKPCPDTNQVSEALTTDNWPLTTVSGGAA